MKPQILAYTIRETGDLDAPVEMFVFRQCDGEPMGVIPYTPVRMADVSAEFSARLANKMRHRD